MCRKCGTIYDTHDLKFCAKCGGAVVKKPNYFVVRIILYVLLVAALLSYPVYKYFTPVYYYADVEKECLGHTVYLDGEEIILNEKNVYDIRLAYDEEEEDCVSITGLFTRTCVLGIKAKTNINSKTVSSGFYMADFKFNGVKWELTELSMYPDTVGNYYP